MLLELDALSVRFGTRTVVDGVSLSIARGERFGLIGESGSGKTMTALSIAGLLPAGAAMDGTVRFDGAPLPEDEKSLARLRGKRIGFVFQEPMSALNPLMRIGRQIEEVFGLTGTTGRIVELLAEVGLEAGHARRYPHELSGGQRQRAMIAMALASGPDLLIADEPTSALDLVTQAHVLDLIAGLCARRHMALLFISHDLKAVARLCTRVAVLSSGRIAESGSAHEVFSAPADPVTRALVEAASDPGPAPPPAPGETLLAVHGLVRRYGPGRIAALLDRSSGLVAVDGIDLAIARGETVALVGPSGCGKSTLARMLVGLDAPSAGRIVFDGVSIGRPFPRALRRRMSLVFQDPFSSFDPRMSVGEALGEQLGLVGPLTKADRRARLEEAIVSVGLPPAMLTRYPHEFSGGQRQRLAIARALITRPEFVVLDEPVSALDMSVRGAVLDLLAALRETFGLTYLVISHDLDMVAGLASRVLVMERGRIVEAGPTKTLFTAPKHRLTQALVDARLPPIG